MEMNKFAQNVFNSIYTLSSFGSYRLNDLFDYVFLPFFIDPDKFFGNMSNAMRFE